MTLTARINVVFSRHRSDDQNYQFLDMFESSVGRVTEELTQLFHNFEEASTQSRQWLRPKRRHKLLKSSKDGHESFDPLLDIRAETSLLTEVRDSKHSPDPFASLPTGSELLSESLDG